MAVVIISLEDHPSFLHAVGNDQLVDLDSLILELLGLGIHLSDRVVDEGMGAVKSW